MKKHLIFLNYAASVIIILLVIGVLYTSYRYLIKEHAKEITLKIEYTINATDSLGNIVANNEAQIAKLDSILSHIKECSNNIQEKQKVLIEEKQSDFFFNKLYTALVAIILTIAGFFGFKSITEIKYQAIEEAKKEAKKEAKEEAKEEALKEAKAEFTRSFNDEYRAKVFDDATEAMNKLLRTEIGQLEKRIFELENKSPNTLEEEVSDINNTEPTNPFDNE